MMTVLQPWYFKTGCKSHRLPKNQQKVKDRSNNSTIFRHILLMSNLAADFRINERFSLILTL